MLTTSHSFWIMMALLFGQVITVLNHSMIGWGLQLARGQVSISTTRPRRSIGWLNRLAGSKPGFGRLGENDVPGDIHSGPTADYGNAGFGNPLMAADMAAGGRSNSILPPGPQSTKRMSLEFVQTL